MKINKLYLNMFKKSPLGYIYPVRKGIYIIFDEETLEYKGVYAIHPYFKNKEVDDLLDRLAYLDYLEV